MAKTKKRPRKIVDADITFVSLVPRGKNQLRTLYKEEDGKGVLSFETLTKAGEDFAERGLLYSAVWVPLRSDYDGDWTDVDVIERMVHSFAKNGMALDLRHDEKPLSRDRAYVAENFTIQKGDPRFADLRDHEGALVDPTGGWGLVVKIEDPELRKAYREGSWGGVSLFGNARVVEGAEPPLRKENMDEAKLTLLMKGLLDQQATAIAAAISAALKPEAPKVAPTPEPPKPDMTTVAGVRKHLAALRFASVDQNDPEAVAEHLAALEKEEAERKGRSNQPLNQGKPTQLAAELSLGSVLARFANQEKGAPHAAAK